MIRNQRNTIELAYGAAMEVYSASQRWPKEDRVQDGRVDLGAYEGATA